MPHSRSSRRISAQRSGVLVIDLQEKLCPPVVDSASTISRTVQLVTAARLLQIPTAATVQYPKGLGPLVSPLNDLFAEPEEKLDFSAAVCRHELDQWVENGRNQIVITGIETHICVMQTVLDLISEGLRPIVVADAVSARDEVDHQLGLERMRDEGATITTTETVLFEWLETAEHPQFKSISKIVKG